jgi:hypothetical protein
MPIISKEMIITIKKKVLESRLKMRKTAKLIILQKKKEKIVHAKKSTMEKKKRK